MFIGATLCERARLAVSDADSLATWLSVHSVETPEAVLRNASFVRSEIAKARAALDRAEAALPKPKTVRDAA